MTITSAETFLRRRDFTVKLKIGKWKWKTIKTFPRSNFFPIKWVIEYEISAAVHTKVYRGWQLWTEEKVHGGFNFQVHSIRKSSLTNFQLSVTFRFFKLSAEKLSRGRKWVGWKFGSCNKFIQTSAKVCRTKKVWKVCGRQLFFTLKFGLFCVDGRREFAVKWKMKMDVSKLLLPEK